MPNREYAQKALKEVRESDLKTSKSSNKLYVQGAQKFNSAELRTRFAKDLISMSRSEYDGKTVGYYGSDILEGEVLAGNCLEYACAAAAAVTRLGGTACVMAVDKPGDHVFCVVGKIDLKTINLTDVSEYGDDIWICDPWTNLACPARNYYDKFLLKMRKWYSEYKVINYKGAWMAPTDPGWIQSIKWSSKHKRSFV